MKGGQLLYVTKLINARLSSLKLLGRGTQYFTSMHIRIAYKKHWVYTNNPPQLISYKRHWVEQQ